MRGRKGGDKEGEKKEKGSRDNVSKKEWKMMKNVRIEKWCRIEK